MKKSILAIVLFGMACSAWAGDVAYTIRATELKDKPFSDAKTLRTLALHSKVDVQERQASWSRVKSGNNTGWVKMLSLQLEASANGRQGDSGLGSLFNVASTGRGSSAVTTGVRGLSEEQLKSAKPNPRALQAGKKFTASQNEAERFAEEGQLQARDINYLSGGQ